MGCQVFAGGVEKALISTVSSILVAATENTDAGIDAGNAPMFPGHKARLRSRVFSMGLSPDDWDTTWHPGTSKIRVYTYDFEAQNGDLRLPVI